MMKRFAVLILAGWCGGLMLTSADAQVTARAASTILSIPIVWPNSNLQDMVTHGVIQSSQMAFVLQYGADLPWEAQQSNKRLCAAEQVAVAPEKIELKVGEVYPMDRLLVQSSAFGIFYFDAAVTKKWKHKNDVFVFDPAAGGLRALSAGTANLELDSLCKTKRLKSPLPTFNIAVVVTQ